MICAIMQPTYMPWLGYFNMIQQVDVFVFLDNVQLEKRSWQVRNRIKGPDGEVMLTLPVKARSKLRICDVPLDDGQAWNKKHLYAIQCYYSKASAFGEVYPIIERFYTQVPCTVGSFNKKIISCLCRYMGISTQLTASSDMDVMGVKDELLANICLKIGADAYLSAQGSARYINRDILGGAFVKNNIDLFYLNYQHPNYPQQYGQFLPYMGIYDLLFNVGFDKARTIIASGSRPHIPYRDFSIV